MNIQIIEEHSVDLDLLPEKAVILDAGCRGFEFTDELQKLGHTVYSVDCDDLKTKRNYHRLAISHENGTAGVKRTNDKQATSITEGCEIEKLTIDAFAIRNSVEKFDLVKIDIEGEEYDILYYGTHPLAKQISVEFHAHCGVQTKEMLDSLLSYLSEWYTIHGAVWEKRHGCSENYWDILFIAK